MSRGERNGNTWIKENVLRPRDRLTRIENAISAGIFDSNYCLGGIEGWIEHKAPKTPARSSTPLFGSNHKFTQEQKNFALAQTLAGGMAWGFVNTDEWRFLIAPRVIEEANTMTLDELLGAADWAMRKGEPVKEHANTLRIILRRGLL